MPMLHKVGDVVRQKVVVPDMEIVDMKIVDGEPHYICEWPGEEGEAPHQRNFAEHELEDEPVRRPSNVDPETPAT